MQTYSNIKVVLVDDGSPDRKGDIKHSNADISKAKKLLGYDPDYSFADGIKLAIEWYKENL